MPVSVKVDAVSALAKFSPAGIPVQVRNNLRQTIPGIMRDLSAEIDTNLGALKSRNRLQLKGGPQGQMVENATEVVGRAEMTWTGDPKQDMVPQVLETGAKPHVIEAKNAKALAFYWPVVGGMAFFKRVNHPGFPGIHYMENAFKGMQSDIVSRIETAVSEGMQE